MDFCQNPSNEYAYTEWKERSQTPGARGFGTFLLEHLQWKQHIKIGK